MSDTKKLWDGCMDPDTKAGLMGVESLSDSELLAVVLRTGTRGTNALEAASRFLAENEGQLLNLYDLELSDMTAIPGLGKKKALLLKAVAEVSKRLVKQSRRRKLRFDRADTIAAYYMEELRHERQEILLASFFDAKGNLTADKRITTGSLNKTMIPLREIFHEAILKRAAFIVILHNHPSGDPTPSMDDKEATARLRGAGELMEISLLDHIIIGDNSYFSFYESGLLTKMGG